MQLWLEDLSRGIPVILKGDAAFYVHNTMACFDRNNHQSDISLKVSGEYQWEPEVHWQEDVTDDLRNAYNDIGKMVDFGACTIALLLIRELTEYTAVRQSAIGTTIDYYLEPKIADDTRLFKDAVRLEVSGILTGKSPSKIRQRISEKENRLKQQPGERTFIVVVEFGQPQAVIQSYD